MSPLRRATAKALVIALTGLLFPNGHAAEFEAPGKGLPGAQVPLSAASLPSVEAAGLGLEAGLKPLTPAMEGEALLLPAASNPNLAPAQLPTAELPAAEQQQSRQQMLEALAPQNAANLSDDQAKVLSAQLIEGSGQKPAVSSVDAVTGGPGLFTGPVFKT